MKKIVIISLASASLCLAACGTGYTGSINAKDVSDEAVNDSYHELMVSIDENDFLKVPKYSMYISLGGFGLGRNTVSDAKLVQVANTEGNNISLSSRIIDFSLLKWIFWFLPTNFPPVAAYYGEDYYQTSQNVSQINYSYVIQIKDSSSKIIKNFNDYNKLQKIKINSVSCYSEASDCVLGFDQVATDKLCDYKVIFEAKAPTALCHSFSKNITQSLLVNSTLTINDHALSNAKDCKYKVNLVANRKLTEGHERLSFTYVTTAVELKIQ